MRFAYFPGCSLRSSGRDYDLSFQYVTAALGIELSEVRDWTCCGALSARASSRLLSLALPVLNLSHAEQDGFEKMIAPCAVCLSRFKTANMELKRDPELSKKVHEVCDYGYQGKVQAYHPLEVFLQVGLERISQRMKRRLSGLKIACYYGCLLKRPHGAYALEQIENPQSMESIVRVLGARPLEWTLRTGCCGNSISSTQTDIALKLSNDILAEAKKAGADILSVACPFCQANLDTRQQRIEETYKKDYQIPVLYITQLMGLAFGAFPKEIGLEKLMTSPQEVLGSIGLM